MPRLCIPAVFVLLGLVLGCNRTDPIVTYTVPKHESIQVPVDSPKKDQPVVPPFARRPQQASGEQRMLAALVLTDQAAWSVKAMTSPSIFPEDALEQFEKLVSSLEFASPEKPTWKLGERWTEKGPSGMRAATFTLDDKLGFSLIRSVWPSSDKTESILENVNRWRDQVNRPKITADQLGEETRTIATRDKRDAIVLDMRTKKSAPQSPAQPAMSPASRPGPQQSPQETGFTSSPPKDWQPKPPGMMQKLTFAVTGDSGIAEVSVSTAGGPVLLNVNRWRGKLGMEPANDTSDLEETSVSGQPGLLAELHGASKSTVVVMVPASAPRWFIKLDGDTEVVKQQTAAFREYLTTIQIAQYQ